MKRNSIKYYICITVFIVIAIIIIYLFYIDSKQSVPKFMDVKGVVVSGSIDKDYLHNNQANMNTDELFIEKVIAAQELTNKLGFRLRDLSLKSAYQYIRIDYIMKDGTTRVYTYKERQCKVYDIWKDIIIDGWL